MTSVETHGLPTETDRPVRNWRRWRRTREVGITEIIVRFIRELKKRAIIVRDVKLLFIRLLLNRRIGGVRLHCMQLHRTIAVYCQFSVGAWFINSRMEAGESSRFNNDHHHILSAFLLSSTQATFARPILNEINDLARLIHKPTNLVFSAKHNSENFQPKSCRVRVADLPRVCGILTIKPI